jgi:hypothetical protein
VLVESGSKPRWAGVSSAFKFCVIESSIVPRDMRKKSVKRLVIS